MKKSVLFVVLAFCLLCLAFSSCAESTADWTPPAPGEKAEWTVLFYICGSDLESKYGYAAKTIGDIQRVMFPESYLSQLKDEAGAEAYADDRYPSEFVNVLIETGGSTAWHTDSLDLAVNPQALQRWRMNCMPFDTLSESFVTIEQVETCPLASMADPSTLSEYIRWGVEKYPAKKYALVLWGHGNGALSGLFRDELFDQDILLLSELKKALADGGVYFDTILLDACLMANLETAAAVRNSARWMVASEELVPGNGTACRDWLQELIRRPEMDGRQLGRNICDMTMNKYANSEDLQARSTLTWSLLDLTRAEAMEKAADHLFEAIGYYFSHHPLIAVMYGDFFRNAEEFGDGVQQMRDFSAVLYNNLSAYYMKKSLRDELMTAFSDLVVYSVRGSGRSGARGLSFCYPPQCSAEELKTYAQNCPSPHYLAFLDAITDWTAPDWVYQQVDRLPNMRDVPQLNPVVRKAMNEEGFPVLIVPRDNQNVSDTYYRLYSQDDSTGQTAYLGRTDCVISITSTGRDFIYTANEPWKWPGIDGTPVSIDLVLEELTPDETLRLYNIPVQIGTEIYFLRCGRSDYHDTNAKRSYEVYGVWEKYDDHSVLMNRNVTRLSQLAGQEYRLILPLTNTKKNEKNRYMPSGPSARLYRALDVEETTLPTGTYYLEYEVNDTFLHPYVLERLEMRWDGKKFTFPNLVWEGEVSLGSAK